MRIGLVVAQDFWLHFREIHKMLTVHHTVNSFRAPHWPFQMMSERVNRILLDHALRVLLHKNDVVFFEWGEEYFVRATHLQKRASIIVRLHSHELWDFAPRVNWANVDRIILVSSAMERKLLERYPSMAGRTVVIHNGILLSKFTFQPRPFSGTIGTLSRIEPLKRIDGLIIAFHRLHQKGYDLTLHIGGTCTEPRFQRYADEVVFLVKRLGLEKRVIFDGYVDNAADWLQGIDIFVSNSCSEGLQVALLEAMATGCFCLSHAWDGSEEVLPEEHIFFSECELVEKIGSYVQLEDEAKSDLRAEMRRIAEEKFNIEEQKQDICRVIDDVLEERRKH